MTSVAVQESAELRTRGRMGLKMCCRNILDLETPIVIRAGIKFEIYMIC